MINILEEVVEEESKENEVDETEEKPEEAKPEPEPEPDPKAEEGMLLFPIDAESIYHIAYKFNFKYSPWSQMIIKPWVIKYLLG